MLIGYKKLFPWKEPTEFEPKIIHGYKKHTIRIDKCGRWHAGRKIHHCYGVRTKYFSNFFNNTCSGTQNIEIYHRSGGVFVKIDGSHFYDSININYKNINNMLELARNDGFETIEDFFKWFNIDYKGKIIHWTDLRY